MINSFNDLDNDIIKINKQYIYKNFINLKNININKILFTKESLFSSSKASGSKRLIEIIKKFYKTNNIKITDGTANIGTDTINLYTVYNNINAVEISSINFKALKNNIDVFNINVNIYNNDITEIINNLEQDIIYIDAPWGGPNYKKKKILIYI